ncbi:hypothetical protein HGRIS_011084 [Hohenbuehelia grisea]|uniref:Uncharacterized protein n=1 Tax=Hohenbuehelia grisea TaxID=104357 RepID=A0ABR3IYX9_9AGAR
MLSALTSSLSTLWRSQDSRLYIDKIFVRSGRYANWEPAREIQLGDYGEIDRSSGEFHKRGNIFVDPMTKDLVSEFTIKDGATDDKQIFVSLGTSKLDFEAGPTVDLGGLADASIKEQFEFTRSRGAALVMHQPTPKSLEGNFEVLPKDHLRGMYLVTEVTVCPDYFMFLSEKTTGTLKLVLQASCPIIGAAVGGEAGAAWQHKGVGGVCKHGTSQTYTPLYYAKKIDRRVNARRGFEKHDPNEYWMPSTPPWKALDSDGEEELSDSDDEEDEAED